MSERFEIEELLHQDTGGVVFRATDRETGAPVAVRRFFSSDDGAMSDDLREVFEKLVDRLKTLRHPALRGIIDGGCDPNDGVAYLVTEWTQGHPLADTLAHSPLPAAAARGVFATALAASQAISQEIGADGLWVDLSPSSIITREDGTHAYWFSPQRWLAGGGAARGYPDLANFVEQTMGWQGRMITDTTGGGLGGWMKWLRMTPPETSLHHIATELDTRCPMVADAPAPPAPAANPLVPPHTATRPAPAAATSTAPRPLATGGQPHRVVVQKSAPVGLIAFISILACAATGLGVWAITRTKPTPPPATTSETPAPPAAPTPPVPDVPPAAPAQAAVPPPAPPEPLTRPAAPVAQQDSPLDGDSQAVNDLARKLSEQAAADAAADDAKKQSLAEESARIEADGGVFQWDQYDLLRARDGQQTTVEGVFEKTKFSGSGKTLYLLFTRRPGRDDARGAIFLREAAADLTEASIQPLLGKKIRINGLLKMQTFGGLNRPEIFITQLSDIQTVE